jgi:hypothetical protein
MAQAARQPAMLVPFELRLASWIPLGPVGVTLSIAAVLVVFYFGVRLLLGVAWWLPDPTLGYTLTTSGRAGIVLSLLVGYLIGAQRYAALATFRDLQELGVAPRDADLADSERPALARPATVVHRARLWGALGVALGAFLSVWFHTLLGDSVLERLRHFSETWLLLLVLVFFGLVARGGYMTVAASASVPGLADESLAIDLSDLRPLRTYGRMALRGSLLWIVGLSIGSLLFINNEYSPLQLLVALGPIIAVTLAVALLALLLPVRDVRRRVREAKEAELARVDVRLRELRDTALAGDPGGQERLAGLLAYRTHVAGLPEWPFDPATRSRFLLYLLIPLGSWFGGAMMERLVSSLLD